MSTRPYPAVTGLLKTHELDVDYVARRRALPKTLALNTSTICQARCPYCTSNMHRPKVQQRQTALDRMGLKAYVAAVEPIVERYSPMLISFNGPGEPTLTPDFVELVKAIEHGNHVRVQTNMISIEAFRQLFAAGVRLSFSASYHVGTFLDLEQPKRREQTLANLREVLPQAQGAQVIVPLAPAALRDADQLIAELLELKALAPSISLQPLELGHVYAGKRYPGAYTAEERALVAKVVEATGTNRNMPKNTEVLQYMTPKLHLKGMPCWVGIRTLKVGLFGGLWRCAATPMRRDVCGTLENYNLEALYNDDAVICGFDICRCKAAGYNCVLRPFNITVEEYYAEYHRQSGNHEAAQAIEEHAREK